MMPDSPDATKARFMELLERALEGWRAKAEHDFSAANAQRELDLLRYDPVYDDFGLANSGYVLVRLMGRMSISIGRRLGELYDNLPKYVASARFGLRTDQVAARIDNLNLDVCIPFDEMQSVDEALVRALISETLELDLADDYLGLGIEIRYNFNPNDSARLRKDVAMAEGLLARGLLPVYLVFSSISPRAEAIDRLRRAGWHFVIGHEAAVFTQRLLGLDLSTLLRDPEVVSRVDGEIGALMATIMQSSAMKRASSEFG